MIADSNIDRKTIGEILLDINNSDFPYTTDLQIIEDVKNPKLQEHIKKAIKDVLWEGMRAWQYSLC